MARIESAPRIDPAPRAKIDRRGLVALMAPAPTSAPAPKQRKSSKRHPKRRKGKTLITRAVDKLTAVLKRPQSTNIEKAEACFKVTFEKMQAYEQEQQGRGKWNAAAARKLEARLGKTFHEDKMKEYLAAAVEERNGASDIYCGVPPNQPEHYRTQYLQIEEYWNEYPAGRVDAFIVYKYDMPNGHIRFALENGTQVKTGFLYDVHFYDRYGSQIEL
ncbi:uncharacterized protein EAF01_007252 [Botrytis porri]|uniref:Uncharacterized protein n=1 Tax=Botrytis porri TaxID=87229 RepID=A0A4Z1KH66_9HELO|nr:uncharacterized protein EAF01_007252 [Botrytis porri]KAF7901954.1 hypothetical protein EAF01_007252 [Botrytis porri]TGO85431.1 hypothetical protein BPOR_0396g00030 [Botrytis porri]